MSLAQSERQPIRLPSLLQEGLERTQYGALCYRVRKDKVQVLLVTSRGTGRWIIPKGWPIPGSSPAEAAAREAWEEAGVLGRLRDICLGIYSYAKRQPHGRPLPCVVAVYPVKVRKLEDDYPEAKERRRKWVSLKKAASLVEEPELAALLRGFNPAMLRR